MLNTVLMPDGPHFEVPCAKAKYGVSLENKNWLFYFNSPLSSSCKKEGNKKKWRVGSSWDATKKNAEELNQAHNNISTMTPSCFLMQMRFSSDEIFLDQTVMHPQDGEQPSGKGTFSSTAPIAQVQNFSCVF